MAVCRIFTVITLTLTALIAYGQSGPVFAATTSLADKMDPTNRRLSGEDGSVIFRSSVNCPIDCPLYDTQREGKDETLKLPFMRLETPLSHYLDERVYYPVSHLRSKKAQKAILLDVGDYVIKGNGQQIMDVGVPARVPSSVGGILRSSGK